MNKEQICDFIMKLLYSIAMNVILIAVLAIGVAMVVAMYPKYNIAAIIIAILIEGVNIWMTIDTFNWI